jgi:uridine phosphorylase
MFPPVPILLRPTAPVAPDALLPGDPARAMRLAQALLEAPRMSNHAHGLWGYHGTTADGRPLTVQATGVGAPSGAMVLADLAELGTRRAVRVGPCVSLAEGLRIGDLVIAERVLAADGTSAALGARRWVEPDPGLSEALMAATGPAAQPATVASTDVLWEPTGEDGSPHASRAGEWASQGALAAEMQAAALFALGARLGVAVACLLVVADVQAGPSGDADEEKLAEASIRAAEIGSAALRTAGQVAAQVSGSETLSRS